MMEVKVMGTPVKDEKKEEKEYGPFDKWEVESWVRSFCEVEEVKQDPEKMKYVKPLLEKKLKMYDSLKKSINSIEDIRAVRKQREEESEYDDE